MRVLIVDFDFFTAVGGGQTFYRRVVERHPEMQFLYPSRGPDLRLRAELPSNAEPFALDSDEADPGLVVTLRDAGLPWSDVTLGVTLGAVGRSLQGESLDIVEVPSFRPCAHLVRPLFAAHGIRVGRVSLGLLGWVGMSLRKAGAGAEEFAPIETMEAASVAAADTCYTISELHAAENVSDGPTVAVLDMHDVLEVFPTPDPDPLEDGPPDLWYVGRMDPAKAPDLFLQLAALVPRVSFRRLLLAGPDNGWVPAGQRWSDDALALAEGLGLSVEYRGLMSNAALRQEVYRGRSVLIVPSRTDSFNFVALEALANGCPILLSRNTGVAGFLQEHHPAISPPIVDPEDLPTTASTLARLLADYPACVAALRSALRDHPLPAPRNGFMRPVWEANLTPPLAVPDQACFDRLRPAAPLAQTTAAAWRPWPATASTSGPRVSAVVVTRTTPNALGASLATLARQGAPLVEVLAVAEGAGCVTAASRLRAARWPATRWQCVCCPRASAALPRR